MFDVTTILEAVQSDAGVNLLFAMLCLWAATGRGPVCCALAAAALHLMLVAL